MKFMISTITLILAAIAKYYFDLWGLIIVCAIGGFIYTKVENEN